jgi:hypothetical protein
MNHGILTEGFRLVTAVDPLFDVKVTEQELLEQRHQKKKQGSKAVAIPRFTPADPSKCIATNADVPGEAPGLQLGLPFSVVCVLISFPSRFYSLSQISLSPPNSKHPRHNPPNSAPAWDA